MLADTPPTGDYADASVGSKPSVVWSTGVIPDLATSAQFPTLAIDMPKQGQESSTLDIATAMGIKAASLYNHIDPLPTREKALQMEEILALELRRKGYAVWFN